MTVQSTLYSVKRFIWTSNKAHKVETRRIRSMEGALYSAGRLRTDCTGRCCVSSSSSSAVSGRRSLESLGQDSYNSTSGTGGWLV